MPLRTVPASMWNSYQRSKFDSQMAAPLDSLQQSLSEAMQPVITTLPEPAPPAPPQPDLPDWSLPSLDALGDGQPKPTAPDAAKSEDSDPWRLPSLSDLWPQQQTPAAASPRATPSGQPQAMPTGNGDVDVSSIANAGTRASRFAPQIAQVAREEGVPADVLAGLLDTEDSGEDSVSPAGAAGLMQVVPGQGFDLPGEDARDPLTSIRQGARAIKEKYRVTGSWDEAGAAYFGYGTDAGGMTTDGYRQRYQQNRARYQGQGGAQAAPAAPQAASVDPQVSAEADRYDVAFGFNQPYGAAQFNPSIPNHRGVDLQVRGADRGGYGEPVKAFRGGTVVSVTSAPNGGNGVIVQNADGLYDRYFHFDATSVKEGQQIGPGEQVGVLGESGSKGFPHVHYEVSRGINGDSPDQMIDPTPYMRASRVSNAAPAASPPADAATPAAPAAAPPPAAAGAPSGPALTVRDQWGNEFEMTQEQLDKRPGGSKDLTIVRRGPVAQVSPLDMARAGQDGMQASALSLKGMDDEYDPRDADSGAHEVAPPPSFAGAAPDDGNEAGPAVPAQPPSSSQWDTVPYTPDVTPDPTVPGSLRASDLPGYTGASTVALPGGQTPPPMSDQEILQGQGAFGQAVDAAGRRFAPDPIVQSTPEDRQAFLGEQPNTLGELNTWRERLAGGAADAIARGLGQDPDTVVVGVTINGVPVQMTVSDLLENFTDPLLGVGFGVGDMVLDAAGKAALRVAAPFLKGAARQTVGRLLTAEPVQAVGQAIRSGAESLAEGARGVGRAASETWQEGRRVAQAANEADRAAPGMVAPGVFGVGGIEPITADVGAVARPRVVPPDVADQLDFPIRIPDDPRTIRAIEAAGGSVDPDRGVTLGVTRAQAPDAAGGVATRGGVFYEAIPEGGQSSYARSANDAKGVGGTEVLPRTPTRFRSPLILSDAPGSNKGFDEGMRQLGVDVKPGYRVMHDGTGQYLGGVFPTKSAAQKYIREQELGPAVSILAARSESPAKILDGAIDAARAAGPEGSADRARALKTLVRRYGGDPNLVDDMVAIRGADASESAWAIKENILAAHARRNKYDGVVTVQQVGPSAADVAAHPKVKALQAAFDEASAEYAKWNKAANDEFKSTGKWGKESSALMNQWSDRYWKLESELPRVRKAAEEELSSGRITELMDPREGRNPTPASGLSEAQRVAQEAQDRFTNLAREANSLPGREGADDSWMAGLSPEHKAIIKQTQDAYAELDAARRRLVEAERTPPGYTLRDDIPRRGGSTEANASAGTLPGSQSTDRLGAVNRVLGQGVASAVSGGVGAQVNEIQHPDDPDAGIKGFAMGAVGPFAASRAVRAGLKAAGREGEAGARGALATFGIGGRPASEAASAAPNPVMQRMARQMAGQHTPSGVTNKRGLMERWAQTWTDDRAGIRNFQEAVSASIGRPLTAGESVAELTRVNPASVAAQRLDDSLRPALQRVGDDEDYLAQYLVHNHNIDVAREIGQRAYDDAIQAGASPQIASRRAMAAANQRKFSGDLSISDTQQQLQDIEQRVLGLPEGADRWQAIKDGAQSVWDFNRQTLERKKDAGIISDQLFTDLTQRYPKYVRTDIADYFDKGSGGPGGGGKRIGLSDIGVQKISNEGTAKERVNPLLSTIDQTYSAETAIARNKAGQAFEELLRLDPTWQSTFKEVTPAQGVNRGNPATTVPSSYTLRNGEQYLRVWDGGQERTFLVPPEYAALISPKVPSILNSENLGAKLLVGAMNTYKSLITSKNPAFSLIVSPIRDAGDYAIREGTLTAAAAKRQPRTVTRTTRAGNTITLTQRPNEVVEGVRNFGQGVAGAVGAMGDYAKAVPDAFAGILEGTYKGDLARMMREGAGQGGRPRHDQGELRNALRDLQRTNGLEIKSAGDALRLVGNVLTLGAEPIGGRLEQVPRLAASRRAARRGASDLGQAMAFRDATVDFQRAGEWSRAINTVVPFFNVAMQGGAQTVRTAKANPAAFMGAVAASVGTMTMASEAWNNSDEQRAADYGDVPDYLKKSGVVFMLPGVEGQSSRGDRLPNYVWLPVGQYGALVQTAKEAARNYVDGKSGADLSTASGWGELGAEVAGIFSPIRGDSAASVATSIIPPGLATAADLAAGKDLYRGSTIATDRRDEQASALSQGSAAVANAVTGQETRPSQWEYAYRDLGGYAATLATEGSNLVAEKMGMRPPKDEDRPLQNMPIIGGLTNRIVRDSGGQRLQDATEDGERVPEGIRSILEEAGIRRADVMTVPSTYKGATLTRDEQQRWQEMTNSLVSREVAAARRSAEWRERGADKEKIVRTAISSAREQAAERALRRLDQREIDRRVKRQESRRAS